LEFCGAQRYLYFDALWASIGISGFQGHNKPEWAQFWAPRGKHKLLEAGKTPVTVDAEGFDWRALVRFELPASDS